MPAGYRKISRGSGPQDVSYPQLKELDIYLDKAYYSLQLLCSTLGYILHNSKSMYSQTVEPHLTRRRQGDLHVEPQIVVSSLFRSQDLTPVTTNLWRKTGNKLCFQRTKERSNEWIIRQKAYCNNIRGKELPVVGLVEVNSSERRQDWREMSRELRRAQSSPVNVDKRRLGNSTSDHEWETLFEQTGKGTWGLLAW